MNTEKKYRILLVIRWPVGGIRTFIRYFYNNFDASKFHLTIIAPDIPELKILIDDLKEFELDYIPLNESVSNLKIHQKRT